MLRKKSVFSRDKASDRLATPKRSALSIHEQHKMTSAGCIHKCMCTHMHIHTKYMKFSKKIKTIKKETKTPAVKMENAAVNSKRERLLDDRLWGRGQSETPYSMITAVESRKYEVKTSVVVTGPRGEGELNLGTGELYRGGDSVTCDGGHTTGVGDL